MGKSRIRRLRRLSLGGRRGFGARGFIRAKEGFSAAPRALGAGSYSLSCFLRANAKVLIKLFQNGLHCAAAEPRHASKHNLRDSGPANYASRCSDFILTENFKVFVHLFQKVAVSKGRAFGRASQSAERLMSRKLRRGSQNNPVNCFGVGVP